MSVTSGYIVKLIDLLTQLQPKLKNYNDIIRCVNVISYLDNNNYPCLAHIPFNKLRTILYLFEQTKNEMTLCTWHSIMYNEILRVMSYDL